MLWRSHPGLKELKYSWDFVLDCLDNSATEEVS